jgi:hypothetical protein
MVEVGWLSNGWGWFGILLGVLTGGFLLELKEWGYFNR